MFSLEYNRNRSLVTRDPILEDIFGEIRSVIGPSGLNVLIVGASGTGKEGIASAIHWHSSRKDKPFIAVNCAAIPESLAEAELFGHEKGSFTGAAQMRKGYFEAAAGGTLFLDELGDLPLHLQAKLLRVLEEGEIVRVGSSRPIPVDVRVIAATHRDLKTMMAEKAFREDLYYRLAADTVCIPSLQERPEDIAFLAELFASLEGEKRGLQDVRISSLVKALLNSYRWPGNIRELKSMIASTVARHAFHDGPKGELQIDDLPKHFFHHDLAVSMATTSRKQPKPVRKSTDSSSSQPLPSCTPRAYRPMELRASILGILAIEKRITLPKLAQRIGRPKDSVRRCLTRLEREEAVEVVRRIGPSGLEVRARM